jgi:hypothetical protein
MKDPIYIIYFFLSLFLTIISVILYFRYKKSTKKVYIKLAPVNLLGILIGLMLSIIMILTYLGLID